MPTVTEILQKSTPHQTEGNNPPSTMTRAAPHPTLQRIDRNVYFSCPVLMSGLEKQKKKHNPCHSTQAVIR